MKYLVLTMLAALLYSEELSHLAKAKAILATYPADYNPIKGFSIGGFPPMYEVKVDDERLKFVAAKLIVAVSEQGIVPPIKDGILKCNGCEFRYDVTNENGVLSAGLKLGWDPTMTVVIQENALKWKLYRNVGGSGDEVELSFTGL